MTERARFPLKLTLGQIEAGRSAAGGFTKKQLKSWGVPWPPPKGWQKALLTGREIPRGKRCPKQAKAIARRYEAQRKAEAKRKAEADHRNFDREAGKGL